VNPLVVSEPESEPPIETFAVPGSDVGIDEVAMLDVTALGCR
jgi:hypothetical protein